MGQTVNKIKQLISDLKSQEIMDYMNQWQVDKIHLLKLIVESKIGFDQAMMDKTNEQIFADLEEAKVYSLSYYSDLIMFVSTMADTNKSTLQSNYTLQNFYLFHKILFKTCTIALSFLEESTCIEQKVEAPKVVKQEVGEQKAPPVKRGRLIGIPKAEPVLVGAEEAEDVNLSMFLSKLANF